MSYHKLGSSDLMVSSCCLGTCAQAQARTLSRSYTILHPHASLSCRMTWGNQNTDEEAASQLSAAWDAGVNFVDTAEAYPVPLNAETQGATDRAIAKWMSSTRQPRDGVILATKVCGYNERFTWFREDGSGTRVSAKQIVESVEASTGTARLRQTPGRRSSAHSRNKVY